MVAKLCHRIIHLPPTAYTVTTVPSLPARLLAPLRRRASRWRLLLTLLILCLSIFLSVLFDRPARAAAETVNFRPIMTQQFSAKMAHVWM